MGPLLFLKDGPPAALIGQMMAERFLMHVSSIGQAVHTAIAAATQRTVRTQKSYVH